MPSPRILIVKLSSFGDILHGLPLADSLRAGFPEATIDWVVRSSYAPLLDGNPNLNQVVSLDRKDWSHGVAMGRRLRAKGYDTALDIQGLFYSGWIAWLSGAPQRIGFDANREGNRLFLTDSQTVSTDSAPMCEKILRICDRLGIPRLPVRPQTYLASGSAAEADTLLQTVPEGLVPVGVVVGASTPVKTLSPERWSGLLERFAARGWHPVLIGGDAEVLLARQLATQVAATDLTGRTPFRTLASVLARCATVVGGDTGALHLAVSVGTPVVGLYGVTDPRRTGPGWGAARHIVLDSGGDPSQRNYRRDTGGALDRIDDGAIVDAVATLTGGGSE